MQKVIMDKSFLLNLDDERKKAIREKVANKEIELELTETQQGEAPHADNPITPKAQPQEEKKEYSILKKMYDVVTNNPVANYLPTKIKEWSSIDEEKKVDREILSSIESLARVDTRLVGDASPQQKEQYLLNVAKVLEKKGYKLAEVESDGKLDYVALDTKGNQKEITNNFFNSLVDGVLADKYEITGAAAGAAKGYNLTKAIPNPWVKALGVIGGGVVGAITGTAADTAEVTYKTGQEFKVEDFFNELHKSAALDVAGTVVGTGVVKVAGKAIELPKAALDYVAAENIAGAKKILKKITDFSDTQVDDALEQAKVNYKEVEDYTRSGITDQTKQQEELLATAQADKKFGSSLIHDVVLGNVDAAEAVAKTVDVRTKNLINSFEDVTIDGTEVKGAVNAYEKQVGANYGNMRDTFKEAFQNVDYAFDLKALKTDEIMRDVVDDIVNPFDKQIAENLLLKVEKIIGDEGGLTRNFDNLIELRQVVNDFYARSQKSLKHDSKEAFAQLKKNIDAELYSAIDKNIPQEMQKPLKDMFDGAIKEYKEMYAIKDTKLYSTLMDDGLSAEKRMNALINHTADDQMEFATLLQKLPKQEQVKIENSITKTILDKNLFGNVNELQVIDYKKALTTLGKLENFMVTAEGKESIKLIKSMAEKFGDDFELMRAANQAGVDTNAGIATTIVGRLEYKLAKKGFDRVMRLIPFSDTAKRMALQKHIGEALERSRTPMDMAKRVAGSEDLPKADKADLLGWARDFNSLQGAKNAEQAQKIAQEIEAKDALKAQADADVKEMFDSFETIDPDEILAVQKLSGYDALAQTVQNLNNPGRRSVEDVRAFLDAKSKLDADKLMEQTTVIKYPLKDADAKIAKLLENSPDEVAALIDEQSLKALRYDIKQGKIRNDKLSDFYKNIMQLHDAKAAQPTPKQLLQGKEVALKDALRRAEFEESVDDLAAAATHRATVKSLQDEIDFLRQEIPIEANPHAKPKLSSQAQEAKDIADMNYHNDEDEAKKAVQDLFRKNNSEEKKWREMSPEDKAEQERLYAEDVKAKQEQAKMSDDEWDEANMLFNKGIDNIAVGTYAGIEQDENGDISFDPAKFVLGLGGYTAVKAALKNKKAQGVLKEYAQKAVDIIDMNPAVYKENGLNAMFVGSKPNEMGAFSDTATKKVMKEIDDSKALWSVGNFKNGQTKLPDILDHKELYAQYPELKDVTVEVNPKMQARGQFIETEEAGKFLIVKDATDITTMLHEIQHNVQSKEGWARGGSVDEFKKGISDELNEELYAVQSVLKDAIKRKNSDNWIYNSSSLEAIIKTNSDFKNDIKQWAIAIANAGDKDINKFLEETPYGKYQSLSGEQMARATAYRANMTPEQRASESMWDTLKREEGNVPQSIVKYGDGISEMSVDFKNQFVDNKNNMKKDIFDGVGAKNIKRNIGIDSFKEEMKLPIKTDFVDGTIEADGLIEKYGKTQRIQDLGWIRPTIEKPDIVLEYSHKGQEPTFNHIKIFEDGGKNKLFLSVTSDATGKEIVVTMRRMDNASFKNIAKSGKEVFVSDKLAEKGIKLFADDRTAYSVSPDAISAQGQVSATDKIIPQTKKEW